MVNSLPVKACTTYAPPSEIGAYGIVLYKCSARWHGEEGWNNTVRMCDITATRTNLEKIVRSPNSDCCSLWGWKCATHPPWEVEDERGCWNAESNATCAHISTAVVSICAVNHAPSVSHAYHFVRLGCGASAFIAHEQRSKSLAVIGAYCILKTR